VITRHAPTNFITDLLTTEYLQNVNDIWDRWQISHFCYLTPTKSNTWLQITWNLARKLFGSLLNVYGS